MRRRRLLALAACRGGGADPVPGPVSITEQPGGVATTYVGPISGFGSVIVNGMRFDTVGAAMADDDGRPVRLQDLSLGMTVKATPATAYKDVAGFASLTVGSDVEVYGVVQSDNTVLAMLQVSYGSRGFEYEHYGVVSNFVSVSSFKVNGMAVDASAARFEDGTQRGLPGNQRCAERTGRVRGQPQVMKIQGQKCF